MFTLLQVWYVDQNPDCILALIWNNNTFPNYLKPLANVVNSFLESHQKGNRHYFGRLCKYFVELEMAQILWKKLVWTLKQLQAMNFSASKYVILYLEQSLHAKHFGM